MQENHAPAPHDTEIQQANQDAFNALMSDTDASGRKWILEYVEKTGISMRSREWLPAALVARLALEIGRSTRTFADKNAKAADSITEVVRKVDDRIAQADLRIKQDEEKRAAAATRVTQAIAAAADQAVTTMSAPMNAFAASVATATANAILETVPTATAVAASEAARVLTEARASFLRRNAIWFTSLLALGTLLGASSMHWIDLLHASNPTAIKSVNLQRHANTKNGS